MPKKVLDDKAMKKAEQDYQKSLDDWKADKANKPKQAKRDADSAVLHDARKAYRLEGEQNGLRNFILIEE